MVRSHQEETKRRPSPILVLIDAEPKLNHAMDSPGEVRWLIEIEAACQQGHVKQRPNRLSIQGTSIATEAFLPALQEPEILLDS